ncbi:SPOR domain-containing protein [Neisseria shayeganii]|uniref:Sporulation domain protein n=1 Tax=Neisseria shayeganii 871 TaxID=1032488 RepID=G4CJ14_9NEIS|nr:SPOR domain-containing protein [Neisseria shayeganii]EGY52108.1 sporulation domain protein [Neisseria shayeganii 871]
MPPQYNPRLRRLEEYEQMKRKNRRRLVGALLMAGIAALLLAKVLGGSENTDAPGSITVSDGGAEVSAPAVQVAPADAEEAAARSESETVGDAAEAAVPVPPADSAERDEGKQTRVTVLPNPLTGKTAPTPPESKPAPAPREAAKPADAPPAKAPASREESAAPPAKTEPPKSESPQPAAQSTPKPAESRAARPPSPQQAEEGRRQNTAKPAGERERRQQAESPARRPAQAASGSPERREPSKNSWSGLSPEEILNNRAARQAESGRSDPQDILNGRSEPRRTVIQVGAYTSEEQARAVQKRLADAGVSAYVAPSESNGNRLYRVRTGSYPSAAAANQALGKIKAQGLDGMLLER